MNDEEIEAMEEYKRLLDVDGTLAAEISKATDRKLTKKDVKETFNPIIAEVLGQKR